MDVELPGSLWIFRFANSTHRKLDVNRLRYLSMLDQQGRRCAICETIADMKAVFAFCVDHDHKTGKVRGLLCRRCNLLIGSADDDSTLLINAAAYVTKHKRQLQGHQTVPTPNRT